MDELRNFCLTARLKFYLVSLGLFIVLEPLLTIFFMLGDEDLADLDYKFHAVFSAILLLIAFIFFHYRLITKPRFNFKKCTEHLNDIGLLGRAIDDVHRGQERFEGNIIFGDTCIIGKGLGVIVPYSEVSRIYVNIKKYKVDIISSHRRYIAVDIGGSYYVGGTQYNLCHVKTTSQFAREWREMAELLEHIAPDIEVK
ncbi:MAG: hypothetical protein IIY78_00410 [Clostridia bacterium]|nr:hypothetical protein [Clostridia bacterium]